MAPMPTGDGVPVAPPPDASLAVWQAYMAQVSLSRQQGTTPVEAQAPDMESAQAQVDEMQPQPVSAPIPIPVAATTYLAAAPGFRPLSPFG
jgi:hypothetical protein